MNRCPICSTEYEGSYCPNGCNVPKVCPKCGMQYTGNFCPNGCDNAGPDTPAKKSVKAWQVIVLVVGALVILGIGILIGMAIGGGNADKTGSISSQTQDSSDMSQLPEFNEAAVLADADIGKLYSNPDAYQGQSVILVGQVFTAPEIGEGYVAFQMFEDIENSDRNTLVASYDTDLSVSNGDFVRVKGVVSETYRGTNLYGNEIVAPIIVATEVEVIDYAQAVSPALASYDLNMEQDQHGYKITLQKVEFAENETRLYVKVDNNGQSNFSFYSFNTLIVQNGKQYEEEHNYNADYPEVQSSLLPGVSTEGIIAFPAMDPASFKVVIDAHSDDYDEDFEDYVYDVAI